jgi:hypothetical protein
LYIATGDKIYLIYTERAPTGKLHLDSGEYGSHLSAEGAEDEALEWKSRDEGMPM